MVYKFSNGEKVNARLSGIPLGQGIIESLTIGNTPTVPMYRVTTKDGTYPLYEEEISILEETCSQDSM